MFTTKMFLNSVNKVDSWHAANDDVLCDINRAASLDSHHAGQHAATYASVFLWPSDHGVQGWRGDSPERRRYSVLRHPKS